MKFDLALITGATSGVGKEMCQLLAQKGIPLILSGRNQNELKILQDDLSPSINVQIVQADLSQLKDRQALIAVIQERAPDLIINSAGFGLYGDALTYSTREQVDILEVNARALLELTLEAARVLISKGKRGIIFNISSAAAFQILPTMAVYAASKAFVSHFSEAFDFEVKRYGIRILTICPGMVETKFQTRAGGTNLKDPSWEMMTASYVAKQIWKQIERQDSLNIIDWKYKLLTLISYLFPKS